MLVRLKNGVSQKDKLIHHTEGHQIQRLTLEPEDLDDMLSLMQHRPAVLRMALRLIRQRFEQDIGPGEH